MLNILQHIPLWAVLILAWIVNRGLKARNDRVIDFRQAFLLPVIMLAWSAWRMLGMAHDPAGLTCWLGTFGLAFALCRYLRYPAGLRLDSATRTLLLPGSSLTLVLLLVMYAANFCATAFQMTHPAERLPVLATAVLSLVYGSVSGIFFARAVALWQLVAGRYMARG